MSFLFPRVETTPHELRDAARRSLDRPGWRFGHATARPLEAGGLALDVLLGLLPVAAYVPGCPPHPWSLIHGILLAMGREW